MTPSKPKPRKMKNGRTHPWAAHQPTTAQRKADEAAAQRVVPTHARQGIRCR